MTCNGFANSGMGLSRKSLFSSRSPAAGGVAPYPAAFVAMAGPGCMPMPFTLTPPPKKERERIKDALFVRSAQKNIRLPGGIARSGGVARGTARAVRKRKGWARVELRFWMYFYKMRGKNPATYDFSVVETLWSFGGAFIAMLALAYINIELWGREEQGLLLGSFGASAMLVFGAPHAPFAQPRNVIGGHIISALVGVLVQQHLGAQPWLASALAVALSVAAMHVTATLHPPGGATSLIAVVGSPELKEFGYTYALYPVGVSVLAMVLVGVFYNNLSKRRSYPIYWW